MLCLVQALQLATAEEMPRAEAGKGKQRSQRGKGRPPRKRGLHAHKVNCSLDNTHNVPLHARERWKNCSDVDVLWLAGATAAAEPETVQNMEPVQQQEPGAASAPVAWADRLAIVPVPPAQGAHQKDTIATTLSRTVMRGFILLMSHVQDAE